MAFSLIQSVGAATSVAAPTSITVSGITATTAGNVLYLWVAVGGSGTPGITTPANWTLVGTSGGATQTLACFSYPSNPGGITSVTVSLTGTATSAVAVFSEGNEANPPQIEFVDSGGATGTTFPATVVNAQTTPGILYLGEVWFCAFSWNSTAATFTAGMSTGWTLLQQTLSTGGTPNTGLRVYFNTISQSTIGLTAAGNTLNVSTNRSAGLLRIAPASATPLNVAGSPSSLMTVGYSGALGGLG